MTPSTSTFLPSDPREPHRALPADIAAVDADWLTQALRSAQPGIVVERAEVLESLGGACTKLRMALRTNDPAFPSRIIVKGCFEPHGQLMVQNQLREVQYYRAFVPSLDVETVRIFSSQVDDGGAAALIMEDLDLRGVRCLRAVEPIASFDLAAAFLGEAAKIHARWWDAPEVAEGGEFGWILGPQDPVQVRYIETLKDEALFNEKMNLPRAAASPRVLRDRHRLRAAFERVFSNAEGFPLTICHGDMHLANLYVTADGAPGFLDWTCRRSPFMQDINYFIVGCLDVVDRRRWERPLLQHYLERLAACGIDAPDYDTAWRAYRCYSVWGELTWLLNLTDFHSETSICAMASRFGTAMVDHDTFGLLGV